MKKATLATLLFCLLYAVNGCKKFPDIYEDPIPGIMPSPFCFVIVDSNNNDYYVDNTDSTKVSDSVALVYYYAGSKYYIGDLSYAPYPEPYKFQHLFGSRDLIFKTADVGIHKFYLERKGVAFDSIEMEYRHYENGSKTCQCYYELVYCKFNGQPAINDSLAPFPVWVFRK